jgi:hypothetical protein
MIEIMPGFTYSEIVFAIPAGIAGVFFIIAVCSLIVSAKQNKKYTSTIDANHGISKSGSRPIPGQVKKN